MSLNISLTLFLLIGKQKPADYVFCGHCNTKVARKKLPYLCYEKLFDSKFHFFREFWMLYMYLVIVLEFCFRL